MRFVKRLLLQGYKTFASPTEFVFDAGVTAIVGPNGSGKSNIADALRWVLGEQSYGTLRGKRTEDMIFSGSEHRARLGMAQVAITLDNASGWLPTEYGEVEIARRAYRSGDNEYYLNGSRVRLRDIAELLGNSGLSERTYSVVGQGLVDQALSQRPEERRRLFEEAAGITVHQTKRDQAAARLEEARDNLTRAHDIISELTPRLRYLKGQARRAQEYQQIRRDLDAQLRVWYGFRWRQAHLALATAQAHATDTAQASQQQMDALNHVVDAMADRRHERATLRDHLGEWHREAGQLHRQAEAVQRALAVRLEQVRLWGEQQEELARELVDLRAGLEDAGLRLAAAQNARAEAQSAHDMRRSQVAAAQAELDLRERERAAHARQVTQRQDAIYRLRAQLAEATSRLAQGGDRRRELEATAAAEQAAAAKAMAQAVEQEAAARAAAARLEESTRALAALDAEVRSHTARLSEAQEAERQATEALNVRQRALVRLQDQRDMLMRLRDEGAGLAAGARAVLAARTERGLSGVLGALGDLIEVPADLERAVEAALGGRVQDIVVRRWADAESAIALLKQRQAGRATFLPLDTLRPGRLADVPGGIGILGRASDLVRFDPQIRPAVELALGNVLVTEDLPTARRLLGEAHGYSPTLVTRAGEIVRPTGSVTGGSEGDRRDSGLLARTRVLRELAPQIDAAAVEAAAAQTGLDTARARQQAEREALSTLRAQREATAGRRQELETEQATLDLATERARQSQRWHETQQAQAAGETRRLEARAAELAGAEARLKTELATGETALATDQRTLAALAADDLLADLARQRAEAAVSEGQLRSHQVRVDELAAREAAQKRELAQRAERLATLQSAQAEAHAAAQAQEQTDHTLAVQLAALAAQIDPAEARVAALEAEQRTAEDQEHDLREQARMAQMRQAQADLSAQRAQDELSHLRGEIEKELGLVTLAAPDEIAPVDAADEDWDSQPPLPLGEMVTRLPVVAALPEGLDADVRSLRAQLARLGPVNLDALAEYNEVEARYNFLSTQAADSEKAIESLEQVITELDRIMEREFLATFRAVAAEFRVTFTALFGGGSARLVLTDPESPTTTGVEIIARPPGKREQGLALLSGGERALTAGALIFSILKSRPTPFCVMDEVDAALDEANVERFREALRALSQQTQFILITHNRGTIEVADTLYGISMGPDHTSQVLSLRLEGREVVPHTISEPD